MSKFYPDLYIETIYDLDIEYLKKLKIKGIIFDLDDTLVKHGSQEITKELLEFLQYIKKSGFKAIILSNNTKKRVSPICNKLGLEFVWRGMKPLSGGFKKAIAIMKLKNKEICVIGDQIFSDVWGAKRMGMHSILVKPISNGGGFIVNFKRIFEAPIKRTVFKNMDKSQIRGKNK